jgi:polysaccharide pyruvyl transferase WcaK-like protein
MSIKVLLLGASGKGNFGDELIAWIAVKLLTSINPNIEGTILTFNNAVSEDFYIHSSFNYSNYYLHFPSLKHPQSYFFYKSIKKFKGYSVAIFPGGGFLYDYSLITLLSWYRKFLALKKIKLPIVLIGVGVGPLRTSFSKIIAKRILNLCDLCILRDEESFNLVKKINVDDNKIKLGADLGILASKFIDFSVKKKQKIKQCLVIPRFWPYKHNEENDKLLVNNLAKLVSLANYYLKFDTTVFLPMHRYDDVSLCQKMTSILNIPSGFYKIRTMHDIISPIADSNFIISMRYHGVLLSLLSGKQTLSISYDRKILNLMQDFNRIGNNISWDKFISLDKDSIFECFDNAKNDSLKDVPKLINTLQKRLLDALSEANKYLA